LREEDRTVASTYMNLGDLREWHEVAVKCWKCGHTSTIPHARLKRGRSPFMKLVDLIYWMRCTGCNTRGAQQLTVTKLPRNC
jgi:hypothetical protein